MAPRLAWVVAAASELCDLLRYYPEQERRATYLPACRTLGLDARAVHGELTKLERDLGFSESEQDGRARGVSWLRD